MKENGGRNVKSVISTINFLSFMLGLENKVIPLQTVTQNTNKHTLCNHSGGCNDQMSTQTNKTVKKRAFGSSFLFLKKHQMHPKPIIYQISFGP